MRNVGIDRGRRALLTGRLGEMRPAGSPGAPTSQGEFHIASLIVYAKQSRIPAVTAAIGRIPGVEVHASDGRGKLVVVLETANDAAMVESIRRVDRTDGVICSALVYQQTEQSTPDE
ncbi:MAG: chaperone NapD [Proteobacteria bacterium]|nr:chaperone NapD [Pseudomonadota bacterium]